jgi:transposase
LLRSIPGVGKFLSYARLVPGSRESDGKTKKAGGRKMGNGHLKWAFSEAAVLFLRGKPEHQLFLRKLEKKHGRKKALGVLSAKLGRAVYFMLKRHRPFDAKRFLKL